MNENLEIKEKFFSKISHDLRGSFTSILGFSDILNDPTEELWKEEIKEFANRIGRQSHEAFELLVNFVNWLKLENYRSGLTNEKVELYDVLIDVQNNNYKKLNEKKLEIELDINKTTIIFVDYEIAYSIFNNILGFIIKTCGDNSKIIYKQIQNVENLIHLEISVEITNNNTFLQNIDIRDLNNELSFPIIFALKFAELIGGKCEITFDNKSTMIIKLILTNK